MKTRFLSWLTLLALAAPALAATDLNLALTSQQASLTQTLRLGPGSLATLTFPDTVTDVTVTRDGLIDRKMVGNRVLLAGLTGHGSTPLMITTESGTYTWRVTLSNDAAGSIVSVTVRDPEPTAQTSTPAPAPTPNTPAVPRPDAPVSTADAPTLAFSTVKDGTTLVLHYRVQAGARPVTLDERQISVQGPGGNVLVKPTLGLLVVPSGQTRYGTVTLSAADAGQTPVITWPYRVGLTQASAQQTVQVP